MSNKVPTIEIFAARILLTLEKYPYLIAEENEEIIGYAYAGSFKDRPAYDWSAETSVYVKMDKMRMGVGHLLYSELESILKIQGILDLNVCVACSEEKDEYLTDGSIKFHEKFGYRNVGKFHKCGYKFKDGMI